MFEIYGQLPLRVLCTYCDVMAAQDCAFDRAKIYDKEYAFIDVAENEDITAAFFKKFPNVNQVPQITEDDQYIGGL